MSHTGITSNCAQCHGKGLMFATNFVPKAPPVNHLPYTGVACEKCHSPTKFTNFAGTAINHAAVTAMTCMTCHELGMKTMWFGVQMKVRKDAQHFPGRDCDESGCHNTSTFSKRLAIPLGPTTPLDPRGANPLVRPQAPQGPASRMPNTQR
jgi:hypothetical protein